MDYTREFFRELVLQEPMVYKGIRKRNRDALQSGWSLVCKDPKQQVPEEINQLVNEFNESTLMIDKLIKAGDCMRIYGDGFLELLYSELDAIQSYDQPHGMLGNLRVLNPENITRKEKRKPSDSFKCYVYNDPPNAIYFHPDRIVHLPNNPLPYSDFGVSDLYPLRNIIDSMIKTDAAVGDYMDWCGGGKLDILVKGANSSQLNKIKDTLSVRKNVYFHNEDYEYSQLNPVNNDPTPTRDYLNIKVSAQLDMPHYLLSGVQPGQVTGSDLGFTDYYKSVNAEREYLWKPVINRIYKTLVEGYGYTWEYNIHFPAIYSNETEEADILVKRGSVAVPAYQNGLLTPQEARRILEQGIQDDNGNSVLEDLGPEATEEPSSKKDDISIVKDEE